MLRQKYSANVIQLYADRCESSVSLSTGWSSHNADKQFDVIWVRRKNFLNLSDGDITNVDASINVAQSNFDALHAFLSHQSDRCINHPDNALLIENKAVQLRLAQEAGLRVPPTLISASYKEIMLFCESHDEVVVKSMRPLGGNPTGVFDLDEAVLSPTSCRQSYTIFQQKVRGSKHFRVAVFGQSMFAFEYASNKLDSRFDARSDARHVDIPPDVINGISEFMDRAGLKMGVFDFKESLESQWYFLEVNQQGAFAYLDPLANFPLLDAFAQFLIEQANKK